MQRKTIGEPEEHLWKIHGTPEGNFKETRGKQMENLKEIKEQLEKTMGKPKANWRKTRGKP